MKAVRIHRFGPPEVISVDDVPKAEPGNDEVVVRVKAAGIGPWDGLIRSGKSVLPQPLHQNPQLPSHKNQITYKHYHNY